MTQQTRRGFLATCVAGTLAATACGPSDEGGSSNPPEGPVELRMTTWSGNEGHNALFNEIGEAYVAEHSDQVSKVTFETLSWGDYIPALTTQIAGGNSPDLAWVLETHARQFVESGVLADLTPTLQNTEGYDFDDLIPAAMTLWQDDGKTFAYPFSNSPFAMYANLDLLEAAGQPVPRDLMASGEWTWDQVVDMAAAVVNDSGKGGINVPFDDWPQYDAWWAGWGARAWSEDGQNCTFTSPEMQAFWQWVQENMHGTGALIKPGDEFDFASGDAAFQVAQLSASGGLGDFAWDFLPLPAGPQATVKMVGQGAVGVLSQGPNPEIAADFLAFFTNKTQGAKLAQYFPPPRKSLLTAETFAEAAPALSAEQIEQAILEVAPEAVTKAGHINFNKFTDVVRQDLDAIYEPDADVTAVLDQICTDLQPLLAS